MRKLTSLTDSDAARKLASYLAVKGIQTSAEDEDGEWVIWYHDDEDREEATAIVAEYQQNPNDPRYEAAERKVRSVFLEANRLQKEMTRDQQRLQKRSSGSWWHCYPATYITIGICIVIAVVCTEWKNLQTGPFGTPRFCNRADSELRAKLVAYNDEAKEVYDKRFHNVATKMYLDYRSQAKKEDGPPFADAQTFVNNWTPAQRRTAHWKCIPAAFSALLHSGEIWRLVTPALLHLSFIHIAFNLFAFHNLGRAVEYIRGTGRFVTLCLLVAVGSAVVQIFWSGWNFGGISGVIFGLVGYIWIKGKTSPQHGLGMTQRGIGMAFLWLFLCMAGALGDNIANGAHVGGLIVGMILGYRESFWKRFWPTNKNGSGELNTTE